jgi:hypothetical protein
VLTVDILKERLRWPNIVEIAVASHENADRTAIVYHFEVRPTNTDWPVIRLVTDESRSRVLTLHFGEAKYEPGSISEALELTTDLVAQNLSIVESHVEDGWCISHEICDIDESPLVLSYKTTNLCRLVFDRPPVYEDIDYDQYYEGRCYRIRLDAKEEEDERN